MIEHHEALLQRHGVWNPPCPTHLAPALCSYAIGYELIQ